MIDDQAAAERELGKRSTRSKKEGEDPFNNFERHLFGRLLQMRATIQARWRAV